MPEYTLSADQLPDIAAQHELARQRTLVRGYRLAAERARVEAIKATPVDQGEARRGWEVVKLADEVQLRNDTIHAEVLELGRRPGQTPPPLAPILEWVYRHADELGVGNARSDIRTRELKGTWYSVLWGRGRKRGTEVLEGPDLEEDATNVALAIQAKIGRDGSKPLHIIASRLEQFGNWAEEEVQRLLEAQ